jgi:hypothetical protein
MWIDSAFADVAHSVAKYGPLTDLVKSAGFLVAATLALSLGWMKRSGSSWVPPEEAVPKATTASASLVTMVLLALLFVFLDQPERMPILALAAVLCLIFALIGLFSTIYFMKTYGFETTRKNWRRKEVKAIKLGGSEFTYDAGEAIKVRKVGPDQLFKEAQGDLTLVYTKPSIAKIHVAVTATFLVFQAFGSLALGGAGLLLSVYSSA